jgi:AcrR family transcriptional regulator
MFNILKVCLIESMFSYERINRYNRSMDTKRSRQAHSEATKKALMKRAAQLFAVNGYAHTSIDEIVRQEQLTKGAIYYYFKDKKSLFEGVVDELLKEMVHYVSVAVDTQNDPWDRTLTAIETYLDGCMDSVYRQIVIMEAPAVLGWAKWKEKERGSVVGLSAILLQELMDANYIEQQSLQLLTSIIFGAITEAAIGIAHAEEPYRARDEARQVLEKMVRSLFTNT